MILRDSDSYSTQIWIGVALICGFVSLIGFLSPHIKMSRGPMGNEDVAYSYEMPRGGESEDAPFDLSLRDVRRERRELEALKMKEQAKAVALVAPSGAALVAGTGAKKSNTTVTAVTQMAAAGRVTIAAVSETDRFRMKSGSGIQNTANPNVGQIYYQQQVPAKQKSTTKDVEEEVVLTAAQWRSLLQTQPTNANISKFMIARSMGQIEEGSLIEIVRDLLKDSADDRRNAGLNILDQAASSKIFEFLISGKAELAFDLQLEMQKRTESYSTPERIMYLGPVLAGSEDKATIAGALEQISIALEVYKKSHGQNITLGLNPVSLQQLQIFTATLQLVGQNADSQVSEVALALNQDIRGLSVDINKVMATDSETRSAKIDDIR